MRQAVSLSDKTEKINSEDEMNYQMCRNNSLSSTGIQKCQADTGLAFSTIIVRRYVS